MATTKRNPVRLVLWGLVALVAIAATGLYAYSVTGQPTAAAIDTLGAGDYQLATAEGGPFTRETLTGGPSMLFFGFTHCPDVCPTTLAEMASWYEALGAEGEALRAWFVTVDPERDTAEVVRDYVSWTGRVTGVVGSPEEVAKMAKAWGAFYQKVEDGDGYTMNHTASVFLLDRNGNFQSTIAYGEATETAVGKLRKLIAG